jgi:hypothetical protein
MRLGRPTQIEQRHAGVGRARERQQRHADSDVEAPRQGFQGRWLAIHARSVDEIRAGDAQIGTQL